MGKASSAKKIKRVQQAGVSRRPGQRRALGFPAAVIGIIVLGSVFVWLARDVKVDSDNAAPRAQLDHWHMPFGVYICNSFSTETVRDDGPDRVGIHVHDDGPLYIHVHPFGDGGSGRNARMGRFFEQVNMDATDTSITMPSGETFTNGDQCTLSADGEETEPGMVAMLVWPPQASSALNDDGTPQTEPEIITEDIDDLRFDEDGRSYVLAFVPESRLNKVPPPPSLAELARGNVTDLITPPGQDAMPDAPSEVPIEVPGDGEGDAATTTAPAAEGGDEGDATATTAGG